MSNSFCQCDLLNGLSNTLNKVQSYKSSKECLLCYVCRNLMQKPVLLSCHHAFCHDCVVDLRSKASLRIACPFCSVETYFPDSKITGDWLIETAVRLLCVDKANTCANCEINEGPLSYCKTCKQYLCETCRAETHNARMFKSHLLVSEKCNVEDEAVRCRMHGEPCILFSKETNDLLCVRCFNHTEANSRTELIDLDSAHSMCRKKLENLFTTLMASEKAVVDAINFTNNSSAKLINMADVRRNRVGLLCQTAIEKLMEMKSMLLDEITRKSSAQDLALKYQLQTLRSLFPTIQLYLQMSRIFSDSYGKVEFLVIYKELEIRLTSLVKNCQISNLELIEWEPEDYEAKILTCLRILCGFKPLQKSWSSSVATNTDETMSNYTHVSKPDEFESPKFSVPFFRQPSTISYNGSNNSSKSSSRSKSYSKLRLLIDLAGAFGDEYAKMKNELDELNKRFISVGKCAQEIQRDLTVRKCLVDENKLELIANDVQKLKIDLGSHSCYVDDLQGTFQQIWEEQLDRVRKQQEVYRNHIAAVACLRQDLHRMDTVSRQLVPFLKSLTNAIGLVMPKRIPNTDQCPMEQLCMQINELEPDSRLRVDAIEKHEALRKLKDVQNSKNEAATTIEDVKRRLKVPKDSVRRKSSLFEPGIQSSTSVIRDVDRDRNSALEFYPPSSPHRCVQNCCPTKLQQQQQQPQPQPSSETAHIPITTSPNLTNHRRLPRPPSQCLEADEMCQTFRHLLLNVPCVSPTHPSRNEAKNSNTNTSTSVTSSVANLLDVSSDFVDDSDCNISNNSFFSAHNSSSAVSEYCVGDSSYLYVRCDVVSPTIATTFIDTSSINGHNHLQQQQQQQHDALKTLDIVLLRQGKDPASVAARERVLVSLRQRVPRQDS